jgi:hypothetical protein
MQLKNNNKKLNFTFNNSKIVSRIISLVKNLSDRSDAYSSG